MFALLVPPYPLLTPESLPPDQRSHPLPYSFQTLSPTQIIYAFPASPNINSLGVLLLPGNHLPPDAAAGIYIHLPSAAEGDFRFFGAIGQGLTGGSSSGEASVVFQIPAEGAMVRSTTDGVTEVNMDASQGDNPQSMITVGISIEPVVQINAQLASLPSGGALGFSSAYNNVTSPRQQPAAVTASPQGQITTKILAQRIIKNAFNFLASFEGGDGMVPLKSFEAWWKKFERRVEMDAGFLERDTGEG